MDMENLGIVVNGDVLDENDLNTYNFKARETQALSKEVDIKEKVRARRAKAKETMVQKERAVITIISIQVRVWEKG